MVYQIQVYPVRPQEFFRFLSPRFFLIFLRAVFRVATQLNERLEEASML